MQALGMAIGLGKDYIGYKQGQQDRNDQKTQQDRTFGLQSAQFDNLKAEEKARGAEAADRLNEAISNSGRSFITPGAETTAGGTTGSYGASTEGGGMNDVSPTPAPLRPPQISPAAAPPLTDNGPPSALQTPMNGEATMAQLKTAAQAPKPDIGANPDAYAGQGGLPPQLPRITSGPPPSATPAFTLSDGRQVSQIDPAMTPQGRWAAFQERKMAQARGMTEQAAFNSLRSMGKHRGDEYSTAAAGGEAYSKELDAEYKKQAASAAANRIDQRYFKQGETPGGGGGGLGGAGAIRARALDIAPQLDAAMRRADTFESGLQAGTTKLSVGDNALSNIGAMNPHTLTGAVVAPFANAMLGQGRFGSTPNTAAANYMKNIQLSGQLLKQAIPGGRSDLTSKIDAMVSGVDAGWTSESIAQAKEVRQRFRRGLQNVIDGNLEGVSATLDGAKPSATAAPTKVPSYEEWLASKKAP